MNDLIELITEKQQEKSIEELKKAEQETLDHFFDFYDLSHINISELISRMFTDIDSGVKKILRLKKAKHIIFKEKFKNRNTKDFLKLLLNFYKKTLHIKKDRVKKGLTKKRKKYIKNYKKEHYFNYNALFEEDIYNELLNVLNHSKKTEKSENSRNKIIEDFILNVRNLDLDLINSLKKELQEKVINSQSETKKQINGGISIKHKKLLLEVKKQFKLSYKEIIYMALKEKV